MAGALEKLFNGTELTIFPEMIVLYEIWMHLFVSMNEQWNVVCIELQKISLSFPLHSLLDYFQIYHIMKNKKETNQNDCFSSGPFKLKFGCCWALLFLFTYDFVSWKKLEEIEHPRVIFYFILFLIFSIHL